MIAGRTVSCRHMVWLVYTSPSTLSMIRTTGSYMREVAWCTKRHCDCRFVERAAQGSCEDFSDPFPVNRLPERR